MSHDASKVVLGTTRSSFKVVDNKEGAVEAGLAVRLKNDDTLSTTKADGELLGVSLGKDLSNAKHTNLVRSGLAVPVLVKSGSTPVLGAAVAIDDASGEAVSVGDGTSTAVNAVFSAVGLTGIKEDGTEQACALIDIQGGL